MNTHPKLHGLPSGEASMPTCGLCRKQIGRNETYTSVPISRDLREVRHLGDCATWSVGPALDLRPGDLVYTHRYAISEYGGTIRARAMERTDERDGRGWVGWKLEPADPTDTSYLDNFRKIAERDEARWAAAIVERALTNPPQPRLVFISDEEWTHYRRA